MAKILSLCYFYLLTMTLTHVAHCAPIKTDTLYSAAALNGVPAQAGHKTVNVNQPNYLSAAISHSSSHLSSPSTTTTTATVTTLVERQKLIQQLREGQRSKREAALQPQQSDTSIESGSQSADFYSSSNQVIKQHNHPNSNQNPNLNLNH